MRLLRLYAPVALLIVKAVMVAADAPGLIVPGLLAFGAAMLVSVRQQQLEIRRWHR